MCTNGSAAVEFCLARRLLQPKGMRVLGLSIALLAVFATGCGGKIAAEDDAFHAAGEFASPSGGDLENEALPPSLLRIEALNRARFYERVLLEVKVDGKLAASGYINYSADSHKDRMNVHIPLERGTHALDVQAPASGAKWSGHAEIGGPRVLSIEHLSPENGAPGVPYLVVRVESDW